MNLIKKLHLFLTSHISYVIKHHLNTPLKIIEFIMFQSSYIILAVMLTNRMLPPEFVPILGQFQLFFALYIAFRFRYFGLSIALFFNLVEGSYLLLIFTQTPNLSLLAGLTSKFLTIVSSIIVAFLANSSESKKQKLQDQKNRLEILAVTDDLTEVYNQRFFNSVLEDEIEKTQKNKSTLGLILIDIDNFKMCNDIYGHNFGDTILKTTASILKKVSGKDNVVFRYGGDEFAVISPSSNLQSIHQLAHDIHDEFNITVQNCHKDILHRKTTLSMGLSLYPDMASTKDDLIDQADMALYHSKNQGKNTIHFYQDVIKQLRKNISLDHQQLIGVFRALLSTISAKDRYTLGHSERVSSYCVMIGEALGLSLKDISTLQYAGLLHDIGKIEIKKSVLNKKGFLTAKELDHIRLHPIYSANILEPLKDMDSLIDFVLHHHERYDGKGYPNGLKGQQISLGARILCVADSFDAMMSERPYSKSISIDEAFVELEKNADSQFDPYIVNLFISTMKKNKEYSNVV
ncbi:UNVERIFIED_CONTAM: diguanylate cyclase (GGDEF)-like protein [Acetivibrio alkalicellulosi]